MTDKVQKIREEVENRYEYWKEKEANSHSIESEIRMSECQHLLLMFDSLQEELVSEDLEEAINAYIGYAPEVDECSSVYGKRQAFMAGAEWQKNQIMKDAIDGYIKRDVGGQLVLGKVNAPAGDEFMLLDSTMFSNIHCGERNNVKIIIKNE